MTNKNRKNPKVQGPLDTSEFDKEFIADTFHPLTPEDRKRWERVRAKKPSSTSGKNGSGITIKVDHEILKQVDALAKKMGITRESLIHRGIKAVLAAAGEL